MMKCTGNLAIIRNKCIPSDLWYISPNVMNEVQRMIWINIRNRVDDQIFDEMHNENHDKK